MTCVSLAHQPPTTSHVWSGPALRLTCVDHMPASHPHATLHPFHTRPSNHHIHLLLNTATTRTPPFHHPPPAARAPAAACTFLFLLFIFPIAFVVARSDLPTLPLPRPAPPPSQLVSVLPPLTLPSRTLPLTFGLSNSHPHLALNSSQLTSPHHTRFPWLLSLRLLLLHRDNSRRSALLSY